MKIAYIDFSLLYVQTLKRERKETTYIVPSRLGIVIGRRKYFLIQKKILPKIKNLSSMFIV